MIRDNVLIGGVIVLISSALIPRQKWFLENTRKGQRLVRWFGMESAVWVLRGLIAGAMIFGGLLAVGIIRPIQW